MLPFYPEILLKIDEKNILKSKGQKKTMLMMELMDMCNWEVNVKNARFESMIFFPYIKYDRK